MGTIELSREPVVGLIGLDSNTVIMADRAGTLREIDLRTSACIHSSEVKDGINCIGIIRPSCLVVGTERNFQVRPRL